jgi:hypothetical protein
MHNLVQANILYVMWSVQTLKDHILYHIKMWKLFGGGSFYFGEGIVFALSVHMKLFFFMKKHKSSHISCDNIFPLNNWHQRKSNLDNIFW